MKWNAKDREDIGRQQTQKILYCQLCPSCPSSDWCIVVPDPILPRTLCQVCCRGLLVRKSVEYTAMLPPLVTHQNAPSRRGEVARPSCMSRL